MILSVSRRTDIPNYYSEWFYNRIKEGFVYVRNPMNVHQVSRIDLSPELVDCIVFWTKNPEPMLERLNELAAYKYYFQFTLTGYGKDVEPYVLHKKDKIIPVFQRLSEKIGQDKVIWRYDPIIFTKIYTPEYHLRAFEQIAAALKGYTKKCVVSFVDIYVKNKENMNKMGNYEISTPKLLQFSKNLAGIAQSNGMTVASCAEEMDLSMCGIEHNCCIDREFIERLVGYRLKVQKDKNQRESCGCAESVDIGVYNTCKNGCKYCYANSSQESVIENAKSYKINSPILCGEIGLKDRIIERKFKSLREEQLSIFDL